MIVSVPAEARDILGDPDAKATSLLYILLKEYGQDVLFGEGAVDPVVLYNQIEHDFRITFPPENENKLQALLAALEYGDFFEDPLVFSATALALSEGDLGDIVMGVMEDPTLDQALWAMVEVAINWPGQEPDFSPAMQAYIQQLLKSQRDDNEETEEDFVQSWLRRQLEALNEELRKLGVTSAHIDEVNDKALRLTSV